MANLQHSNESATLKEVAYSVLKREILTAIITPGSPLPEREFSSRYHISRTPVREILHRLHHEGLVDLVPNRGAFVRRLTAQEVVDIFHAREAVESMAARLAAARYRPEELLSVEREFNRLHIDDHPETLARMVHAGQMLHDFLVEASRNPSLQRAYASLRNEAMLVRSITLNMFEIEQASYGDHLKILDAVKGRREKMAEQTVRYHLRATRERLIKRVFR